MMEALCSSETLVLTRATRCNIPEDAILHYLHMIIGRLPDTIYYIKYIIDFVENQQEKHPSNIFCIFHIIPCLGLHFSPWDPNYPFSRTQFTANFPAGATLVGMWSDSLHCLITMLIATHDRKMSTRVSSGKETNIVHGLGLTSFDKFGSERLFTNLELVCGIYIGCKIWGSDGGDYEKFNLLGSL
jgi:hypothetical protein